MVIIEVAEMRGILEAEAWEENRLRDRTWYSAREMRKEYDDKYKWIEIANSIGS